MSTASLHASSSQVSDSPRHPWARSAAPLLSADRWRPIIIENGSGCAKRITVRWDLRSFRRVAQDRS